jgi:hypothetical protein
MSETAGELELNHYRASYKATYERHKDILINKKYPPAETSLRDFDR